MFSLPYLLPFIVTILGQVIYHIAAKQAITVKSPFELAAVAYTFGIIITCIIGIYTKQFSVIGLLQPQNLLFGASLGVGIVLIEIGYIFAYRFGLSISIGSISSIAITTLILIPISMLLFSESLSIIRVIGIFLTITGIFLIVK